MALITQGYPKSIACKNDMLVKLFNELMAFDLSLRKYIPELNEEIIRKVLKQVNMKVKSDVIIRFIMNGYNQIARDE